MNARGQRQPNRWTEDEDAILYQETIKQGTYLGRNFHQSPASMFHSDAFWHCQTSLGSVKDWHRIAAKLPNRTNKDCRKRWVNKVRGGLRSGPWSEAEDQKLREAVEKYGQRFTILSRRLVPGTAGEPTPQASPAPDSPPDAISAFLVEDNEGTHGVGQDFQDNEYLGGLGPLGAPNPNPLDGGEPGLPYQSSAGLAITFAEELGFNLPASPRREDITTTGSMEPLLFGSSGAYQSTSTSAGDPVDTGEPDWSCLYMVNNTDDVPTFSPDVEAPGYGSHGQTVADSFIPDLDTQTGLHPSQAPPNILESPAGAFNKCVKKLQEDPSPAGDGDSDLQSPSFKVVLTAEKCSHELVKYLIDVTKAIQGRVKMEVVI
ncbi:hypothetical protein ACJ41O_009101 [Fusarium nematophilum]